MDSQLSDLRNAVDCLRESARCGDWKTAGELAAALERRTPPDNPEELGEYLRSLQQALIVAKASRSHLAATLTRLNAAARFCNVRAGSPRTRQEFVESAGF